MFVLAIGAPFARASGTVDLPQRYVDTEISEPTGHVISVHEGGDFQAALEAARPGDTIELKAGASFRGPFNLPFKEAPGFGSPWITVRSDAWEKLPPAGVRIDPSFAAFLPKLVASKGPALVAAPASHHYRFVGVEIHPEANVERTLSGVLQALPAMVSGQVRSEANGLFLTNLVDLGSGASDIDQVPHHLIFDRCYLHGDPTLGTRRGIAMNSSETAVINSHLEGFKETGADSQALAGWNGPGPFKIVNNYLEGAGENVMFGGAVASIAGLVPSDIEIRQNHFYKPLSWKVGHENYAGTRWSVKNLFELKNARRVLVDGNVFEHNWPQGQNGFAVLLTVRNESGAMPWAVVEDVTFTNNLLRGIGSGINVLGHDDNRHVSQQTRRIYIGNNLFVDVGGSWGGGHFLQLLDGVGEMTVEHNTVQNTDAIIRAEGRAHENFRFTANTVMHNAYGVIGTGTRTGFGTLVRYFPGASFKNNVLVGGSPRDYPDGNFFPDEVSSLQTRDGNQSPAPGVDFAVLCPALAVTEQKYCSAVFTGLSGDDAPSVAVPGFVTAP